MRVYGSDAFAPLVAFWRQALTQPQRLADRVAAYHPLSKPDFYALQASLAGLADPLEQAAAFFVLNRASFSGTTLSGGMSPGHGRFNPAAIGRLRAFRARNLRVRRADYRTAISAHADKLLYLDPPYANGGKLYGTKGDMHEGFDHAELAALLKQRRRWILSYNQSELIERLYASYDIIEPQWSYGMNGDKQSKEVLIICL